MTTLLLPEKPIAVLPGLAVAIGLNEAIFVQQLHYWLDGSEDGTKYGRHKDGYAWVYNNYAEWQAKNFPFWSVSTIRRVAASCEKQGVVISEIELSSKYPGGRRKWYRIDYEAMKHIGCVQNEQTGMSKVNTPSVQNEQSYNKDTENTSENTKDKDDPRATATPTKTRRRRQSDPDMQRVATQYESDIGMITQTISEELDDALDEYPADWIVDAIKLAATSNVRKWRYAHGILKNWQSEGRGNRPQPKPTTPPVQPMTDEEQAEAVADMFGLTS
jgi:DnaD/phage-associated family protein